MKFRAIIELVLPQNIQLALNQFGLELLTFVLKRVLNNHINVGLSLPPKNRVICLNESPLKMMKNAFYFILETFFVLKIFKFLSRLFGQVGKTN